MLETIFRRKTNEADASNSLVGVYKKRARRALDHQITIMAKFSESPPDYIMRSPLTKREKLAWCWNSFLERKNHRQLKRAKKSAKENLLSIMTFSTDEETHSSGYNLASGWRCTPSRRRSTISDPNNDHVTSEFGSSNYLDRTILIEAIKAELAPKYIKILLHDYPYACACDVNDEDEQDEEDRHRLGEEREQLRSNSVSHPIHIACSGYHEIICYILQASPESAAQRDEDGRLPIAIFLESVDMSNIDMVNFSSVITLLVNLNPTEMNEVHLREWSVRQESVLRELLLTNFRMRRLRGSGASFLPLSEISMDDLTALSDILAR